MTKIKAFTVMLAATLLMFLCTGFQVVVVAETEAPPAQTKECVTDVEEVKHSFLNYLKNKYGADYEFYYNAIIEQWGTIENYLLSFSGNLPEQYRSGWDKFVGWLKEYSPVWAVPLAVMLVIIAAVVGRKILNGAIDKIVNSKLKPVIKELNLQSNATVSMLRAQKTLLGPSAKFEDAVQELEQAEKELTNG